MNYRKILIIVVLALLAGCATTGNYEKILQSWIGSSEDNLVASWGAPVNTYTTDSGNKLLTFGGNRGAIFYNNMVTPVNCTTTFTIANGIVTNWRWKGNGCKSKDPGDIDTQQQEVTQPTQKYISPIDSEMAKGDTEFGDKNYAAAFAIYLKLAEQGQKKAQNNVAIMYELGMGVEKNMTEANTWYEKAKQNNK